jgi:hypothetical protein
MTTIETLGITVIMYKLYNGLMDLLPNEQNFDQDKSRQKSQLERASQN